MNSSPTPAILCVQVFGLLLLSLRILCCLHLNVTYRKLSKKAFMETGIFSRVSTFASGLFCRIHKNLVRLGQLLVTCLAMPFDVDKQTFS